MVPTSSLVEDDQPREMVHHDETFRRLEQMSRGRISIESLEDLTDLECAEAIGQSFASVSQEYSVLDRAQLPAYLPAGRPEEVNIFQVISQIRKLGKTKSTLPIDIPDRLRVECDVDLAEPLADIFNSCLRAGSYPVMWRREWCTRLQYQNMVET